MGATEKVSLTMERHALHLAKAAAERTGVSLSSLVNAALERHLAEVLAELRRRRAAEEVIATFPAEHLPSPRERRELLAAWSEAPAPPTDEEIEKAFALGSKGSKRGASRKDRKVRAADARSSSSRSARRSGRPGK